MRADDRQHDVLGACSRAASCALDLDQHVLRLLGQQRLRGQHVLDLAGADAVRQRAEGAVGGGVRIAADDRHAGQRRALLRADHVDDALALVVHTGTRRRRRTRRMLASSVSTCSLRDRVGDAVVAGRSSARCGRRPRRLADAPDLAAGQLAGLRRPAGWSPRAPGGGRCRAGGAVVLGVDDVLVPDLVVEGACPWLLPVVEGDFMARGRHFGRFRWSTSAWRSPAGGEGSR